MSALPLLALLLTQAQSILEEVRIDQNLGTTLPLETPLVTEHGREIVLGDLFGERPVVLAFVYYECPSLCNMILNDMVRGLKPLSLTPGEDFDVIAISIDPGETPELASKKLEGYLHFYGRPETADGWHFLTGRDEDVRRVAHAAGFHYVYDAETDQYAHASAIMIATPDGQLARYFFGLEYAPRDLKFGLVEASDGAIGSFIDSVLLFCFHYDPKTGRYGFAIQTAVRIGGFLTVGALAWFLWTSLRRERRMRAQRAGI